MEEPEETKAEKMARFMRMFNRKQSAAERRDIALAVAVQIRDAFIQSAKSMVEAKGAKPDEIEYAKNSLVSAKRDYEWSVKAAEEVYLKGKAEEDRIAALTHIAIDLDDEGQGWTRTNFDIHGEHLNLIERLSEQKRITASRALAELIDSALTNKVIEPMGYHRNDPLSGE